MLIHPNPNKPFWVETDVLLYAQSGVLSQIGDDGIMHPVAFISKTFTAAEQNYKSHDREMLAIIAAFKEWRVYLEGAPKITTITDHKALKYFMTCRCFASKWKSLKASSHDCCVILRSLPVLHGLKNVSIVEQ